MSRTYRRKNSFNEKSYVDDWFNKHEHNDYFVLNRKFDHSLKNKKARKAWYHSDNYKPYDSSVLGYIKWESKNSARAKNKNKIGKLKFLSDYQEFDDYSFHSKKNNILYSIL